MPIGFVTSVAEQPHALGRANGLGASGLWRIAKLLAILFVCARCVGLPAANAPEDIPPGAPLSRLPPVHGAWCRAPGGDWVWKEVHPGTAHLAEPPARAGAPVRRPRFGPPPPNRFRPDSINGIKWFLDGRSYFSD